MLLLLAALDAAPLTMLARDRAARRPTWIVAQAVGHSQRVWQNKNIYEIATTELRHV